MTGQHGLPRPLRGLPTDTTPGARLLERLPFFANLPDFPDDRRYHRGHCWALATPSGRLRIGFDAFAVGLLGHATSVVLPAAGATLRACGAGCALVDDAGPLWLRSPVSGVVAVVNALVGQDVSLALRDPYEEGWLLELDAPNASVQLAGLLPASGLEPLAEATRDRLFSEVALKVARDAAQALHPRDVLGAPRYAALVRRLLD